MGTRHDKAVESTFEKAAAEHTAAMADHEEGTPGHAHHQAMAKIFGDGASACQKGLIADTLEKVHEERSRAVAMPTNVSVVAPNEPGVRAVPRAGQREVPSRPIVPLQFQKLVMSPDEEMEEADAASGLS